MHTELHGYLLFWGTCIGASAIMRGTMKVRALLYGALAVGVFDLLDALVFFGLRGVSPIRIPQSIAAGLLGRS